MGVAEALAAPETRTAALEELEASASVGRDTALAAAPVLVDLMTASADLVPGPLFRRIGLMLARLVADATLAGEHPACFGAAFGEGRLEALWASPQNVVARILQKPAAALCRGDAEHIAAMFASGSWEYVRGADASYEAAFGEGGSLTFFRMVKKGRTPMGRALDMAGEAREERLKTQQALAMLLVEVVRDESLEELLMTGAWWCLGLSQADPRVLTHVLLYGGIFTPAKEAMQRMGGAAAWVTVSGNPHSAGTAMGIVGTLSEVIKNFIGQPERPDADAFVESGFFDELLDALVEFRRRGVSGLDDTNRGALGMGLSMISKAGLQYRPEVEKKLRGAAAALGFCLDHGLEYCRAIGNTTDVQAARLCALVFGRDEGGAGAFSFTQDQVDYQVDYWSDIVRGKGWHASKLPTHEFIHVRELCISDKHKALLLNNPLFIPYLIDGLLLAPDHPRADLSDDLRIWVQDTHAECFAQLAVFPPGREALLAFNDGGHSANADTDTGVGNAVVQALEELAERGWSKTARDFAASSLLALSDNQIELNAKPTVDNEQELHLMVSYQWDVQEIVIRICEALQSRGYIIWIDIEQMQGSIMDAMSLAIERAAVVLYGVSRAYKESANCRLEASYAMQCDCDMVPLMMEENYKPKGWLGLILGTRLYYSYFLSAVPTVAAFQQRTNELTREIGERGKRPLVVNAPASTLAPAPVPAADPTPSARSNRTASSSPPPYANGRKEGKEEKSNSEWGPGAVVGVTSSAQQTADSLTEQEPHVGISRPAQEEQEAAVPGLGSISALSQLLSQSQAQAQSQLSEMFYLQLERERERSDRQLERLERIERSDRADRLDRAAEKEKLERAEKERLERAERERAERSEVWMFAAGFAAATCTCGLSAAIAGVVLLQTKPH